MSQSTLRISTSLLALAVADGVAPQWIQLLPKSAGQISAQDGRKFTLDNAAGVISATLAKGPIALDFNHGTDLAAKAGMDAPAAAWIDQIALHGPAGEDGLWGHVQRWTPKGGQAVVDGEYRFVSPVLVSEKTTGRILTIARCALTNDPALVMTGLFHKENDLDKELCALLGLPETATKDDVMAAINKLKGGSTAMCALEKRVAEAAGLDVSNFVALDETTTVALCAKLKAPAPAATGDAALQAKVDDLQKTVALLSAQASGRTASEAVEAAIKGGKITPAQKDWAIDYCARDPKGFETFIGAAPTIVDGTRLAPQGGGGEMLTETEKSLCAQIGLSEDAFLAQKKLDNKRPS